VISFRWDGLDTFWVLILLFFALFTRFWVIQSPRELALSENATCNFLASYHNGVFFMDTEPEFAKLLTYFLAVPMEFRGIELFNQTSDGLFVSAFYTSIRSISAFCAVVVVPCTFLTIRSFGGTVFIAACGGIFALVEPSLISPARFMNVTGLVQLFCALSLLFAALSQHFMVGGAYQWALVLSQGFTAGAAFCSTFNALPFVLFAAFWPVHRFRSVQQSRAVVGLIIVLISLQN
jgi:dolichyl-phosphate-mannose-protein mannosyltransferase